MPSAIDICDFPTHHLRDITSSFPGPSSQLEQRLAPFAEVNMGNHAHTRPAALSAFLSLGLLLACATSAATAPGAPLPNTPTPNGLVVVIEDKPLQPRLNLEPLHNPFISGVALQIRWRDLEPVQGRPDWSKLDQLFSAAESQHKWVQLLIFPGFWSPEWALAGAQTLMLPIQYGPGKGTLQKLPVPWDHV
ncbi:MAG: hypothetical protein WAK20_19515, partial [Candidatus Acidiferrum sp.]